MRGYKILACTSREAEARLRRALPADEVRMALTFTEATQALQDHEWDVVILGAMFDESRALELMQLLASNTTHTRVPIVGIRGARIPKLVSPEIFDVPMRSLGALDVIDFGVIADDDAGNAEIGARIRAAASRKSPP